MEQPMIVKQSGRKSNLTKFLKYLLVILNFFILIAGLGSLAIGIWIVVDKRSMEYIVGSNLYTSSAYILIAVGAWMFVMTFVGCFGALKETKCVLITYFVCLLILFFMMAIAGILGFVFKDQVKDFLKGSMLTSLRTQYGQKNHKTDYWVTEAWDYTQTTMHCCAISPSYDLTFWRKTSKWYQDQAGGSLRPLVPKSCCKLDANFYYLNLEFCRGTTQRSRAHWPHAEYTHTQFSCCSVTSLDDAASGEASNFRAWQNSTWFKLQNDYPRERVPKSCCLLCRDLWGRGYCEDLDAQGTPDEKRIICKRECPDPSDEFVNLNMCQGTSAQALLVWPRDVYINTKGCYPMLLKEMRESAVILGSVGIGVAILLAVSMTCSVCLYRFLE